MAAKAIVFIGRTKYLPSLVSIALCLVVLLIDLLTPRGVAMGIAYIPLVFCSLWFAWPRMAFMFAAIASLLTIFAYLLKVPSDVVNWMVLANRVLTIAALWFVAAIVYWQRQTALALGRSENKMCAVVDHALDGLITISARGIVESFNPACEKIFGYVAVEVIGQNIKMLMPEPYHGEHDSYLSRYHDTGKAKIIGTAGREVAGRRKDGSVFPIDLSVSAFTLDDGQHYSGILRDISVRKEAEKSTAMLAAIVQSSEDAIIGKTLDGNITSWNAGAEHLFGYKARAAIGKHIGLIIPPERMEEDTYILSQIREGKSVEHYETVRLHKDGHSIDISLTVSPILDTSGTIIGASKIARDISERKAAEAKIASYMSDLERSNQELDDFAYIASHDLKEPLRGLFNHASFLLEDYQDKLDEDGVHRLQRLSYLAQRMEQLVNDLLYFSRLGRVELAVQKTNLNEVVDDIRQTLESFLKERNAQIDVLKRLPVIVCDKLRLTEVLRNLVTNAVKYNDKEERHVEIGFLESGHSDLGPEKNILFVRDNGIGIKPEFHTEIFRIFKRLQSNAGDKEGGTGVGLTFVKKIIERHKGHIWLESEPGTGTTFYFTLGGQT